jgi:teichuronic acid exporter
MSDLKQRSVKGVVWALVEQFGQYGVKFVLGIILARLLTPADFGLIGMITVFFAVAEVFVNSGFGMAYVQKKQINKSDADTVFYTNLLISLVLFGILYFSAPAVARFYNQPLLIDLMKVMSIVVVLNAFNIIQRAQLVRSVNFKKLAKVTVSATSISGIIGVISAYKGFGVWALVIQSLTNRVLTVIGFWFLSSYRPGRNFSKKSFKEMFSFGSWLLFSSVIRSIFDNIYVLVIGKFFPVAQLGFYSKAQQLQMMASQNISNAIGSVAFPVYSKLQDDKQKLKAGMRKFLVSSMFFIVPILSAFIVLADPFIIFLLKEKWAPMIPYLQLLCISGILFPINMVNIQALTAQGYSKLSFNLSLMRNGSRIINIIVMYKFSVLYIIIGEVALSFVFLLVQAFFSHKYVKYGVLSQFADLSKTFLSGLIAAGLTYTLHFFISSKPLLLIFGGLFFTSIYLLNQYLYNTIVFRSILDLRHNILKK